MTGSTIHIPRPARSFSAKDFSITEQILRNRGAFFNEVREGIELPSKIRAMLVSSITFFALYGAVMGSSHSLWQTMSSAVKLPLLFLATLIVCVPSLYFFSLLFGSNQSLTIILTAITVTSVLLLSCAPITLFFLLTTSPTSHYQFFKLLNVSIFAVSGLMGIVFLYQGMHVVTSDQPEGAANRRRVLVMWMFVYAFVGSQMAWTVRPFIGAPGSPFELFRQLGGNFYANILQSIGEVLGFLIVR